MKRKHIWKKAFSLSFAFHFVMIVTIGSMVAGFHQEIQRPPEQLITVNLADTPEENAKIQENTTSSLGSLKEIFQSGATSNTEKNDAVKPQNIVSPNNKVNSKFISDSNSETVNKSDQVSSSEDILSARGNSGSGNSSSESAGDGEGTGEYSGVGGNYGEGGNGDGDSSADGRGATEDRYSVAARFAQAVEANKSYPYAAVRLGQQGVVTVNVTLDADGNLISASVVSSAGGNLDKAAINAVYASCPFPHGLNDSINMDVPVHFYLN